ncbi:MAG: sulfatase-like hydrolase/transferase [Kofleriaceae bacterium]
MAVRRPLSDVLSTGMLTGLFAGFAAGAIDAIWAWSPAAQFVPDVLGRVRFVLYTALSHALIGLVVGLVATLGLLLLSRATRLGDLWRFTFAHHRERQATTPREATIGLSVVLVGVPILAAALFVAYRSTLPYLASRHEMRLVVLVAMASGLAAVAVAIPLAFVAARPVETGLARLVRRAPWLASVWAPFIAAAVLLALGAAVWAKLQWDTAKVLPLRGPIVAVVGLGLALGFVRIAGATTATLARVPAWPRRAGWVALPIGVLVAVLATGGSAPVIKAELAYTGLGGGIARDLRTLFDRDHDGYSRYLGGGDCDDSDPTVHPGAPEIPDDGIDQNCSGGDASAKREREPIAFVPVPATVPKDFNVLLITIDTTRADHLGAYGYPRPTSPNIDKVAAEGTVFDQGWAHAPSTRYSMPAILTGRLPLDVYYDTTVWWPGLLPKATTIAEYLAPLGFVTGAITNYEYFDRKRHFDQGFVEYDNEDAKLHTAAAGKGPEETHGSSSKEQSDKAISFVDRHASERWMLWVHYYDPHAAYETHAGIKPFGTDAEARYDGEIAFTDLHLGRVFDELRAKGLYDKTVIVITGDHGEEFGEHGFFNHGYHLYETKVPLIIRVPGLAPRHARTPAGHVDIIPTLVNLAGGSPHEDMMGRSLVDVLAGHDVPRTVFQQLSFENHNEKRGAADGTCHVIFNVSPDPSWEVYQDPHDAHDLSSDPDACRELRDRLARWYDHETIPAGAVEALLPGRPTIGKPLDVDFGGRVRLLAVDVPTTAKPGETVDVTWTWQALGRGPDGWKVFVHLESPTKHSTNFDHAPPRPFLWWRAGQFIRYTTKLTIPRGETGAFTLLAGLWSDATKADLPASGGHVPIVHDAAAVATIEVAP